MQHDTLKRQLTRLLTGCLRNQAQPDTDRAPLVKWPVKTSVRASLTADELVELRAGGRVADFAPARALPVTDLVAGDLSVLAAEGRRLPAEHDALQRGSEGKKARG